MPDTFSSHRDYMEAVKEEADLRQKAVEAELEQAFAGHVERKEVVVIRFAQIDAVRLGEAFEAHPRIVKAVLAACNVAGRAIERDLGIRNFDTYEPQFRPGEAAAIAGYIKPFLPEELPLATITYVDRIAFIDKEIRKGKGGWEKKICQAANRHGAPRTFRKTMFKVGNNEYELDAASFTADQAIDVGIDVKRIEARRDIHKRIDEIVNKATKFKELYPSGLFGAVVYYPFPEEYVNIKTRLESRNISGVVFAAEDEDSIDTAVSLLLETIVAAYPPSAEG
jgi:hypothetical protein